MRTSLRLLDPLVGGLLLVELRRELLVDSLAEGLLDEAARLAAFAAVAAGGRFSAHGAPAGGFSAIDPAEAARLGVTIRGIEQVQFSPSDRIRLTVQALSDADEGLIRPIIGQTFPLEQAAEAHRAIEARSVIAKTLLVI